MIMEKPWENLGQHLADQLAQLTRHGRVETELGRYVSRSIHAITPARRAAP
jgi:hypothetical protein